MLRLLTLSAPSDYEVLAALRARAPGTAIVALLTDPSPQQHLEALRGGTSAAVAWSAQPETMMNVLQAAMERYCLLPVPVVQVLVSSERPPPRNPAVTPDEVTWLQRLADGSTVGELAECVGYSEREMFRVLHNLYVRMQVHNRTEALVKATEWGLVRCSAS